MTIRAVYDTNVVVSAALKPGSIPDSLVALALAQRVTLYLSPPILAEYTDVLRRPKLKLSPQRVTRLLCDIEQVAIMVIPTERVQRALEEDDNRFLECAKEAGADYLVTGNKRHFPFAVFEGTRIVSPAECIQGMLA